MSIACVAEGREKPSSPTPGPPRTKITVISERSNIGPEVMMIGLAVSGSVKWLPSCVYVSFRDRVEDKFMGSIRMWWIMRLSALWKVCM